MALLFNICDPCFDYCVPKFFVTQELTFVMMGGLFFWIIDPFILRGHNFLISNLFLTIINVLDMSRGGLQVLFGH
jgi:hypothetical protein